MIDNLTIHSHVVDDTNSLVAVVKTTIAYSAPLLDVVAD